MALVNQSPPELRLSDIPRMWSITDLAVRLGLCRQTIYNMIKKGKLETVTLYGMTRVTEKSVMAHLNGEKKS